MFRRLSFIFLFATISMCVCVQGQTTLYKDLPVEIRQGQTSSGLTYFIKSDTSIKKNYIALVNKVGAFHFTDQGQLGVPHFIEHLAFQGSKHFPMGIKTELIGLGLSAGRDFGATTNESTNYWINIPAKDSELLNKVLLMVSDWAYGRTFEKQDVEEERSAVKNEMDLGRGRGFESLKEIPYLIFDKNPLYLPRNRAEYANIDTVSINALAAFEKSWYRHDLEALIVVGNINPTVLETQIQALFSQANFNAGEKKRLPDLKRFDVPLSGTNKVVVTDHGYEGVKITIFQKRKIATNPDKKLIAVARIKDAFYNEMVRRRLGILSKRINPQLVAPVHYIDRSAIHGLAGIDALTTNIEAHDIASAKKIMEFAVHEMRRIELWGFTTKEFLDVKDFVSTSNKANFQISDARSLVLSLQNYFSVNHPVWNFTSGEYDSLINSISLNDINEMAKNWLSERTNMDILVSVPDTLSIASVDKNEMMTIYAKASMGHPKVYVVYVPKAPRVFMKDAKDFVASKIEEINGMQLKLPNGATVILKQVGNSGDLIHQRKGIRIHAFSNGGTRLYEDGDYDSALAADALVKNSGLANLNRDELLEWLSDKRKNASLSISPYIHDDEEGIIGNASINNAEELFKLVFLYFSELRKDKKNFSKVMESSKNAQPRNFQDSVRFIMDMSLGKKSGNTLTKARFDKTFKIYRERFANPGDFTFVIVGDFDMEAISSLSVKYLGAIAERSDKRDPVIKVASIRPERFNSLRVTMVGDSIGNATFRMLFPGSGAVTMQEQLELQIIAEILREKLIQRLRGTERLVYGIIFSLEMSRELGLFSFDLNFEVPPADGDRAIHAVLDEVTELQNGKLGEGLLRGAKGTIQAQLLGNRESTSYWTSKIISMLREGKSRLNLPDELKILEGITEQDIKDAAVRFIDQNRYSLFKLL